MEVSELGHKREEVVASHIDTKSSFDESDDRKVENLVIHKDITTAPDRNTLFTLVQSSTKTPITIPQGAMIVGVRVVKKSSGDLPADLSFSLGFMSDFVLDAARIATLGGRVAPTGTPITGPLLNQHKTIRFSQSLFSKELTAQNTLYDAELAAQGLAARPAVNYKILGANANPDPTLAPVDVFLTSVGESRAVQPAIQVLAGNLLQGDVEFVFEYIC